ncbi:MAG TPA: hypothetical protein VFQ85_09355 [Mycobacteriales bacterium]|jgi:hypothetical protein|nr:hypothetical protein [Mycobacteriales bacterium]
MNGNHDAVDDVIAAFSDHLAHGSPRPTLDHLDAQDRQLAEDLMRLMESARGIDPSASAPSLEALLAGTEFAAALAPATPGQRPILDQVQDVLTGVDSRVEVHVDDSGFVTMSYLDLVAHFHLVDDEAPSLPDDAIRKLFDADVDVDLLGIVATRAADLDVRVVSRYDVDRTISTSAHRPVTPTSPSVLPLALAARAILEHSAPEWGEFGLERAALDTVDIADLQTEIAARIVTEEAKRRYQGDKALAYRGCVGHEQRLVELVATGTRQGESVDLEAAVERLARQVA